MEGEIADTLMFQLTTTQLSVITNGWSCISTVFLIKIKWKPELMSAKLPSSKSLDTWEVPSTS